MRHLDDTTVTARRASMARIGPFAMRMGGTLALAFLIACSAQPDDTARAQPVAAAKPVLPAIGAVLDRSALGARIYDDEFDRPVTTSATGAGAAYKDRYWYGWQQGDDASSRTGGDLTVASSRAYNGVQPWTQWGTGVNLTIGRVDPKDPRNHGYAYSAGLLSTEAAFSQPYGYFEVAAALPAVRGAWPAFWLLAKDRGTGAQREVDVFEGQGATPNQVLQTAHWMAGGSDSSWAPVTGTTWTHRYGVMITPAYIAWYVDDVCTKAVANRDIATPLYMIVSMGVGGWDANATPDASRITTATMPVAWVRAYAPAP